MLKSFFFFVVALQPFLGMGQECPTCPSGFTQYGEKCYKAYSDMKDWDGAYETCFQQNSHLVVVRDDATNADLYKAVEPLKSTCSKNEINICAFWTAGKRDCSTNEFVWVTSHGTKWPMQYTNWRKGEPNNARGNEHCLHFLPDSSSNVGWNDTPCNLEYCFICEVDL